MYKLILLALTLMLISCDKPMTNEQVIEAHAACKKANLFAREYRSGITNTIKVVQCTSTPELVVDDVIVIER